jgi:hypothetical protein
MNAILILALLLAAPALASNPATCSADVPTVPAVRAEGKTELAGDVVVTCNGGTPTPSGTPVPQVSITLFANTTITSRSSDLLLLIDEPGSKNNPNQLLCPGFGGCTVNGSGTGVKYDGFAGRPNIFQGSITGTSVSFFGIPLDAVASGSRTLRVVNLRVDATGGNQQIQVNVSIPGVTVNSASQTVAQVQPGLKFSVDPTDFAVPAGTFGKSNRAVTLRYAPGFSRAFRPRTTASFAGPDTSPPPASQTTPGAAVTSESEFLFPVNNTTTGLADSGTRLKAAFNNIPRGIHVWAALTNTSAGSGATARLTASEGGPFVPVPAGDTFGSLQAAEIPIANGSGVAVWEVLATGSTTTFNMPIWFTGDSAFSGVGTVNGSFAPNFTAFPASVPRFADTSTPVNLVVVGTGNTVTLSANPPSLVFQVAPGASPLQFQTIGLSSSTGTSFTAQVSLVSGNWLRLPSNCDSSAGCTIFADATGLAPGLYSGAVKIQMAAGTATPISLPVTLIVQQPPVSGGNNQIFSHIADGGNWKTSIILTNTDTVPATFTLRFWNEAGAPWQIPLGADGFTTQISGVLPVGGSRTIQSDGLAGNLSVGWAELVTTNSIGGTAVFAEQERGLPDSEASVPGTVLQTKSFLLPFDNSAGTATGVAIANPDPTQAAQVTVIFRDSSGHDTNSAGPYNVPPRGHISLVLPANAGIEGVAEFTSTVNIVGLGIRGHGRAFTSLETLSRVPAGNKVISHLAEGAGWRTSIVLVNADTSSARFTLQFFADDSSSLTLSLGPDGRHSELSGTIPAGGSRTIRTDGTSPNLVNGWAQLVTNSAIGGTAIFAAQVPGQPVSEAAVPIIPGGARHFAMPFDGSPGFGTGLAFGNSSIEKANVTVLFRSESGSLLGAATNYVVPAKGHFSVVLPVSTRGSAEITSSNTAIGALGIRSHNGAFTSVRPLLLAPGLTDILTGVNSITAGGDAGALASLSSDWTTVASGDANSSAPSAFVDVRQYGLGRVAAVGDEGLLTNSQLLDNATFAANLMAWLDPSGQRTLVWSGGHGELITAASGPLGSAMSARDFTSSRVRGDLTNASLDGASLLVIGNAQNDFSAAEIQAVTDFVARGGGLLLVGNGEGKPASDYPMNKLAQPFGIVWPSAIIVDPDPQNQLNGATVFHTFYPNGRP